MNRRRKPRIANERNTDPASRAMQLPRLQNGVPKMGKKKLLKAAKKAEKKVAKDSRKQKNQPRLIGLMPH